MLHYKKIFLGGSCNNNCLYCPPDHKNSQPADFSAITNLLEQKESDSVVLYGGEPTLRNDLLQIVARARNRGYRRVKLITNGRSFSNVHYLEQLVNAGCLLFEITLWGSNPNLHEFLTRTPGSFWETMNGLGNLSGIPHDKFVCIRIPVCRENLSDLENSVITALNTGANRIILSLQDEALPLQAALHRISNSINISIFNRVWILTEGIPFCLMEGLEQHISEVYSGWDTVYERTYVKNHICLECIYEKVCPGVEARFAKKNGHRIFRPVKAAKYYEDIRALYD